MQNSEPPKIVTLYDTNLRNIPATLRKIADEIESGQFGEPSEAVLVLMANTLEVFSCGPDSDIPSSVVMLHAAALRVIKGIERYGR